MSVCKNLTLIGVLKYQLEGCVAVFIDILFYIDLSLISKSEKPKDSMDSNFREVFFLCFVTNNRNKEQLRVPNEQTQSVL